MITSQFEMDSAQIASIMGTVGSPLIVISELLKNAVDASARNIDIYYNRDEQCICVENDYKGFSIDEIKELSQPGLSSKKQNGNLTNENGMYLTGSKGLGLLSVFLLCDRADIYTSPADGNVYKVSLKKETGTVEQTMLGETSSFQYTKVTLINVNQEIIDFLSSEAEVRKLRHICTSLYKKGHVPFPKMRLHLSGQQPQEINFTCDFPPMLYDVSFTYSKDTQAMCFKCSSPNKAICCDEIIISKFDLPSLEELMLNTYGIKGTIATRTNELILTDFSSVPSFEGRMLVYEKSLAGSLLKTYGAGVNIYVNEFALYNYLAEENDWLGLADYSQRKKATRLKPHNVFGYVNFPTFNESSEVLKISNERADFIQDLTFTKTMYLLKGVMLFIILNIDVADKNPKYKASAPSDTSDKSAASANISNPQPNDNSVQSKSICNTDRQVDNLLFDDLSGNPGPFIPQDKYSPKKLTQNRLQFTQEEGAVITALHGMSDLCNKIYFLTFELSRLDLQAFRYSISYLYRSLIESSTKYLSLRQKNVLFTPDSLESSVISALNYFGNINKNDLSFNSKNIKPWRDTISKRKLIDTLNQYIHNELPVDALLLQETWNTMKGYIIACLKTV